ncbi:MAG: hypothetical protein ACYCUM_07465 [Solirubrobacteraceae bacterium]
MQSRGSDCLAKLRLSASSPSSRRELVARCLAQAVTVWGLLVLVDWVDSTRLLYELDLSHARVGGGVLLQIALDALLALSLAFTLVGYPRIGGFVGLAWIVVLLVKTFGRPPLIASLYGSYLHWLAFVLVPAVCYAAVTIRPARRERHPLRLAWLAAALLVGGLIAPAPAPLELFQSIGLMNILFVLVTLAGVLALAFDARMAVPFALALISFGLASWTAPGVLESSTLRAHLQIGVTTLGPLVLLAGAIARLISTRVIARRAV